LLSALLLLWSLALALLLLIVASYASSSASNCSNWSAESCASAEGAACSGEETLREPDEALREVLRALRPCDRLLAVVEESSANEEVTPRGECAGEREGECDGERDDNERPVAESELRRALARAEDFAALDLEREDAADCLPSARAEEDEVEGASENSCVGRSAASRVLAEGEASELRRCEGVFRPVGVSRAVGVVREETLRAEVLRVGVRRLLLTRVGVRRTVAVPPVLAGETE
jgi:hypothetical protein